MTTETVFEVLAEGGGLKIERQRTFSNFSQLNQQ